MSDKLAEWIRKKEAEGYTSLQIYQYLVQQGYSPKDVAATINNANIRVIDGSAQAKDAIAVPEAKIETDESHDKTFLQKLSMWLILFFVIALALGLTFFFYDTNHDATNKYYNNSSLNENQSSETSGLSIGAGVEAISSCGGYDCFKKNFLRCEQANLTYTLRLFGGINTTYYYEIFGPNEGLCEMKSKYIENPNPRFVGKEMTCLYNNTLEFETAVQNMYMCQGELYDLLNENATR